MKAEFDCNKHDQPPEPLGVSIIIPCYNAGNYLHDAVDSVFCQGLPEDGFEIIIVNDGSTDPQTLRALAAIDKRNDPHIRIIHQENKGQSAARNVALRNANFRYIAGLDADDMYAYDPDFLARKGSYLNRAIKILEQSPDVCFVDCEMYFFGKHTFHGWPLKYPLEAVVALGGEPNIGVFRKQDALDSNVNGYAEDMPRGEDSHFFAKLLSGAVLKRGDAKAIRLNECYYLYRQHPEGFGNVNARPSDLIGFYRRMAEDCLPLYQKVYGVRTVSEAFEICLLRLDYDSVRTNRLKQAMPKLLSEEITLSEGISFLKDFFMACAVVQVTNTRGFIRAPNVSVARILNRVGCSWVKPSSLVAPSLREMCIEPEEPEQGC